MIHKILGWKHHLKISVIENERKSYSFSLIYIKKGEKKNGTRTVFCVLNLIFQFAQRIKKKKNIK